MSGPLGDDVTRRATFAGLLGAAGVGLGAAALPRRAAAVDRTGAVVLRGDGIDPTGRRDSADAVQAVLDAVPPGSAVVNPSGAVMRLDHGLTVRREGTVLTGTGEWRFRSGGSYTVDPEGQNGFLDVRADYCRVDGIRATNPDGVLNRGVVLLADHGSVTGCTLIGFGQGITVSPAGEFHSSTISGNHVVDVIGDGGGPDDPSSAGESYGDGIVCWEAATVITGNVVSCREGSDARIGIHLEGLDDQVRTPWTHDHRLAVVSGNVVTGRFRRGIVSEGVHHVAITGNAVADATWWSIALISADHCVVSGNTIRSTRTAADTQGSWWGPVHAAITLYAVSGEQPVRNAIVTDNAIDVPSTGRLEAAIAILGNDGDGTAADGVRIAGNGLVVEGAVRHGVLAQRPTRDLDVAGNRISGVTVTGVGLQRPLRARVRDNTITGGSGAQHGVDVREGSRLRCEGNTIREVGTGVRVIGSEVMTVVRDNVLDGAGVGVHVVGARGDVHDEGNVSILRP